MKKKRSQTVNEQRRLWLSQLKDRSLLCALCGELILHIHDLSKDHIIPKASPYNGPNHPDNYQPAHKKCNNKRGCMSMEEWVSYWDRQKTRGI